MKRGAILIADSDPTVIKAIQAQVKPLGMESLCVSSTHDVIECFLHHLPQAVVLRDTLPDYNGWETATLIRAISDTPIIFISDHFDRLSRSRALQLGDEYLTPPWQWQRLPARLTALLRRTARQDQTCCNFFDDGYLYVDIAGSAVTRDGQPVPLSDTEFKLLSCFVSHSDRTLGYAEILQSVWGHTYLKAKSDVSQYVRYLRQKIEPDPAVPSYLKSIRGVGYLFHSQLWPQPVPSQILTIV